MTLEKPLNLSGTTIGMDCYDNVVAFVQSSNDLDTCCSALALIKILEKQYPDKKYSIIGIKGRTTFIPEIYVYKTKTNQVEVNERTLAILSEVTTPRQMDKEHLSLLEKCGGILSFDHHENLITDTKFPEPIASKILWSVNRPEHGSLCEIIWEIAKTSGWNEYIDEEIGKCLFLGMYSDNMEFKDPNMHPTALLAAYEISTLGVNVGLLMREFSKFDYKKFNIFCSAFLNSVKTRNLLFINLLPQMVHDKNPSLLKMDANGRLKQKTMFTCVLTLAQKLIKANTYILVHYSMYNPFNTDKKMVYISMHQENKPLEEILLLNGFKRNKKRWSKAMKYHELTYLIDEHLEVFTR